MRGRREKSWVREDGEGVKENVQPWLEGALDGREGSMARETKDCMIQLVGSAARRGVIKIEDQAQFKNATPNSKVE